MYHVLNKWTGTLAMYFSASFSMLHLPKYCVISLLNEQHWPWMAAAEQEDRRGVLVGEVGLLGLWQVDRWKTAGRQREVWAEGMYKQGWENQS